VSLDESSGVTRLVALVETLVHSIFNLLKKCSNSEEYEIKISPIVQKTKKL